MTAFSDMFHQKKRMISHVIISMWVVISWLCEMLSMDFEVLSPTRHAIHRRSRGTLCVEHCGVPRRLYCVDLWNQKLLTLL